MFYTVWLTTAVALYIMLEPLHIRAQPTATSAPWPNLQANPSPNMVCDKTSLGALDLDFVGGVTTGVATLPWTGEGVFYVDDRGDVMFVFLSPKAEIVSAGPNCNASTPIRIVDSAATFGEDAKVTSLLANGYGLYIAAPPYVWVIEQVYQPLGGLVPHKLAGPFLDVSDMLGLPFLPPDFPFMFVLDKGANCLQGIYVQESPDKLAQLLPFGNCLAADGTAQPTDGSASLNFVNPVGGYMLPTSALIFDQDETSVKVYETWPDMTFRLKYDMANSVLHGLKLDRVMKPFISTVAFVVVDRSYNFNCSVFRLHSTSFEVSSLAEHCVYPESLVVTASGTVFLFANDTAETFPPSGSEGTPAAGPEAYLCPGDAWPLIDANTFYMTDTLCQDGTVEKALLSPESKSSGSSTTVIVVAVVVPAAVLLALFVVLLLVLRRRQKPIQVAPALEDGSPEELKSSTSRTTKGESDSHNPSDFPSTGPLGVSDTIAGSRREKVNYTIAHSTPSSSFDVPEGDEALAESQRLTQRDIILSLLRSQAPSRPAAISSAFEVEEPSKKGSSSNSLAGTLVSEGSVGAIHGEENFAEYRDLIRSGKYHKLKLIGRGAFGSVYSCILANGKTIAMKEMMLSPEDFETIAGDVEREIEVMRQIQHENVIQYISAKADTKTGRIALFMELVTGGSLGSMARSVKEPLPEIVIRRLIRHATEGLAFIHSKGIIHRDIKGDNMLLTTDGVVKLADFGTARSLGPGATRGAQTMIGTPYYMAPELLNGGDNDEGYGMKADVWSLGVTVGELLNQGSPPWPSFANPGQAFLHIAGEGHVPTLPEHTSALAKDFVLTCCRRDAKERPSCAQLLEHRFLQEGEPEDLLPCESVDF